jgi:peptide/nickel transport system permease protein
LNIGSQKIYVFIILAYSFIGLFNSFIANSKPILAVEKGKVTSPASSDFLNDIGLKGRYINPDQKYESVLLSAPIKFGPKDIDVNLSLQNRHLLGTDQVGRDIAAGIVRGCYTSFAIGLFGTLLCGLIGILLGICMAYYSNDVKWNLLQIIAFFLLLFLAFFYSIYPLDDPFLELLLVGLLIVLAITSIYIFGKIKFRKLSIPFDSIMMSIIELRRSIPTLILILVLFPLFSTPSINNVILVIALLGWTNFARHARAETLSIKNREYVTASKLMGAGFLHIAWKHILPNIATTLIVIAAMNFAANILLESTLSFLGMGIPPDEVSWGSMLNDGRRNFSKWQLVLYPGFALFVLVYSVNMIGKKGYKM